MSFYEGQVDRHHHPNVDTAMAALFMTPAHVDRLLRWDTEVMAAVEAGRKSQAERFHSAIQFFRELLATANVMGFANELGCTTIGEAADRYDEITRLTCNAIGFDPWQLIEVEGSRRPPPTPVDPNEPIASLERTRAVVESFVASTDWTSLMQAAQAEGRAEDLWNLHRRLLGFLRRTDQFLIERLKLLAPQYLEGKLSVAQVAAVLGISEEDVLARMDEQGISRAPSAYQYEAARRAELLSELQKDRERRGGSPRNDPTQATRAALSSQRLEGIDARAWLIRR